MTQIFITFIYQPFLNLLVGIYWVLTQVPSIEFADMGVSVIIFTLALRFILLPITISASRSIKERREIEAKVKDLKETYKNYPIKLKKAIKSVFKTKRRVVIAELFNLAIQVSIALMLWRVFSKGLLGQDLHLIYDFMPYVPQPFNLTFLDKFDLTHTNTTLNFVQSIVIFTVETFSILTSPFPISKDEAIRLQIVLPIVSFLIFSQLPAGKKLFVITSLLFSLSFMIFRQVRYLAYKYLIAPKDNSPKTQNNKIKNN